MDTPREIVGRSPTPIIPAWRSVQVIHRLFCGEWVGSRGFAGDPYAMECLLKLRMRRDHGASGIGVSFVRGYSVADVIRFHVDYQIDLIFAGRIVVAKAGKAVL